MPQIIVVIDPNGQAVSVTRVNEFRASDLVTLFPPFLVGENVIGATLKAGVRDSPHLTPEQRASAVRELSLLVPGEQIVIVTIPEGGTPTDNGLLAGRIITQVVAGTLVVPPLIVRLVDP